MFAVSIVTFVSCKLLTFFICFRTCLLAIRLNRFAWTDPVMLVCASKSLLSNYRLPRFFIYALVAVVWGESNK